MNKAFQLSIILAAAFVVVSGCTGPAPTTPATVTSSPLAGSTAGQQTGVVLALTTGPVDTMPENLAVTVDVGQKEYTGEIPVTFQGGFGQSATSKVWTKLTRIDGTTQTEYIGTNKGDSVTLQGTRGVGNLEGQTDRVEVWVQMNNGKTYKIVDVLREYRSRG